MPLNTATPARRRIALVFYRDSALSGGSLRIGETLACELARLGHDVHLIFAYGDAGVVSRHRELKVHFLGSRGPDDWEKWRTAREFLRELRPSILHFLDPVIWLQAAALGLAIPKVLHMHRTLLPHFVDLPFRLAWRAVAPSADAVVFVSETARNFYVRSCYGLARRTHVVRNAIEVASYQALPEKSVAREALRLSPDDRVLLMVGSLRRAKGCFDALSLLRLLPDPWRLVYCGDGPDARQLRESAQEHGRRVVFLGSLNDTRPAYAAADALLFLSHYESFGLFLCEAMAAGVPIFGLQGIGEYQEPGCPLLTPANSMILPRRNSDYAVKGTDPRDLDALAEQLEDLAAYPAKWTSMVASARDWVQDRFEAQRYARELLAVYDAAAHLPHQPSTVNALAEAP